MIGHKGMILVCFGQVPDKRFDNLQPTFLPIFVNDFLEKIIRDEQIIRDQSGHTIGTFMRKSLFKTSVFSCQFFGTEK